jgi:hypothetical protein
MTVQTIVEGTCYIIHWQIEAGCNSSTPLWPLQELPSHTSYYFCKMFHPLHFAHNLLLIVLVCFLNCRKYITYNNFSLIPDKFITKRKVCLLNHLPSNAWVLIAKILGSGETNKGCRCWKWY